MNRSFLDALQCNDFSEHAGKIPIILGMDESGQVVVKDLVNCIHLVIAGASGTGKSTLLHAILLSILNRCPCDDVRLILCDDKGIELNVYSKVPHLLVPVVTDQQKTQATIVWTHTEMLRRLKLMGDIGARSIDAFNTMVQGENEPTLPRIVLVIDDVAAVCDRNTKDTLQEIAKNGRTTGIHLILVTQNPSSKYFAEVIKSSVPTRAVFNVFSNEDEKLLLNISKNTYVCNVGEIIFYDTRSKFRQKIRCFPIGDDIFFITLNPIKLPDDAYKNHVELFSHSEMEDMEGIDEDEITPAVVDVILETGQVSVSMIQRQLKLGYARAARVLDDLEGKGIIGPFEGSKPRKILITKEQWIAQRRHSLYDEPQIEASSEDPGDVAEVPEDDVTPREGSAETPTILGQRQQSLKRGWMSKLRDFIGSIRTPKSKPAGDPIVITTEDELSRFIQEHPLLDEFYTKVVGVTYPNDDGSIRQAILAQCHKGDYITLESFRYQGEPAYAVFTEHGQIGNLSASLAKKLDTDYSDDFIASGTISEITGGSGGLYYGCNIFIRIYQS